MTGHNLNDEKIVIIFLQKKIQIIICDKIENPINLFPPFLQVIFSYPR